MRYLSLEVTLQEHMAAVQHDLPIIALVRFGDMALGCKVRVMLFPRCKEVLKQLSHTWMSSSVLQ